MSLFYINRSKATTIISAIIPLSWGTRKTEDTKETRPEMEQSSSVTPDTDGVHRVMGDLPAWAEKQEAASGGRSRPRYGSLTFAGLILGLVTNLVAAAWQPGYRSTDGAFSLPYLAFGNLGMFAVYLIAAAAAVWLCLRDGERARGWKLLTSVCTLVVLAVCLTPLAQYFHLFSPPLEHPAV